MEFNFAFSIYPTSLIPFGPDAWLFHAVPAALAVWFGRAGLPLARKAYAVALILRLLGIHLLAAILVLADTYLVMTHDPATDHSFLTANQPWPLIVIFGFVHILASILLARLTVQRLRDAGIDQKWAYLLVVPVVDSILMIGLIFYPPTRSAAPAEATA